MENIAIDATNVVDWGFSTPLPLANIGRETVLSRLQRQIKEVGLNPIVLTDDLDVMAQSNKCYKPSEAVEFYVKIPSNIVCIDYMDVFDVIHGRKSQGVFIINTVSDYWSLIRDVVNAGKLDTAK